MPERYDDSFAYDLDLMLDGAPDTLVSAEARAAMRRLAPRLPSLDGGLEIRLHDPAAPTDLSVLSSVLVPSSLATLAGRDEAGALDPGLAGVAWEAVPRLAAAILDGAPPFDGGYTEFWLEFDHEALHAAVPTPCVMVSRILPPGAPVLDLLATAYVAAAGAPPGPGVTEAVARVVHALPEGSHVSSFGVLSGRPGLPARLRVNGGDGLIASVCDALAGMAGEAAMAPVRGAAELIAPLKLMETLTLDLYEDRPPRIGLPIPCPVLPRARPTTYPAMEACLDLLEGAGLCRPEAAAALRRWPLWMHDPRPLSGYPHRAETAGTGLLLRCLIQFKLAFGPGGALEAKAYAGVLRRRP